MCKHLPEKPTVYEANDNRIKKKKQIVKAFFCQDSWPLICIAGVVRNSVVSSAIACMQEGRPQPHQVEEAEHLCPAIICFFHLLVQSEWDFCVWRSSVSNCCCANVYVCVAIYVRWLIEIYSSLILATKKKWNKKDSESDEKEIATHHDCRLRPRAAWITD